MSSPHQCSFSICNISGLCPETLNTSFSIKGEMKNNTYFLASLFHKCEGQNIKYTRYTALQIDSTTHDDPNNNQNRIITFFIVSLKTQGLTFVKVKLMTELLP